MVRPSCSAPPPGCLNHTTLGHDSSPWLFPRKGPEELARALTCLCDVFLRHADSDAAEGIGPIVGTAGKPRRLRARAAASEDLQGSPGQLRKNGQLKDLEDKLPAVLPGPKPHPREYVGICLCCPTSDANSAIGNSSGNWLWVSPENIGKGSANHAMTGLTFCTQPCSTHVPCPCWSFQLSPELRSKPWVSRIKALSTLEPSSMCAHIRTNKNANADRNRYQHRYTYVYIYTLISTHHHPARSLTQLLETNSKDTARVCQEDFQRLRFKMLPIWQATIQNATMANVDKVASK